MKKPKDDSLEIIESDVLEGRRDARVVIRRVMRKDFDTLDDQKRARLIAIMMRWCQGVGMTREMFNANEGRTAKHNKMLQAFKAFKVRLYGISISVGDRRTFIIFDADTAKKQNKADPNILKRAKSRVDKFLDDYEKKEKGNGPEKRK